MSMDYTEVVRHVEKTLRGEWTDASAMFNRQLDDATEAGRGPRRDVPKRLYRRVHDELAEAFTGEWSDARNPLLEQLPADLTAEQCRKLAHLIASRKAAPLYLALLVRATLLGD